MSRITDEKIVCTLFEECVSQAFKESLIERTQCARLYGAFREYLARETQTFMSTCCALRLHGLEPMLVQSILYDALELDVSRYLERRWPRYISQYAIKFIATAVCNLTEVFFDYSNDSESAAQQTSSALDALETASSLHEPRLIR